MGKRIALVQCINPRHNDSTPSMAVYEQGEDKLQVYCFGCGYHAWVSPDEVELNTHRTIFDNGEPKEDGTLTEPADHRQLVTQFFLDRNFKQENIPWGSITMGNEWNMLFDRPFMQWDLLDENLLVHGKQRRYLDTGTPKTKYIPMNGKYADVAWINSNEHWLCDGRLRELNICESWVDSQWVNTITDSNNMTILGTNPDKIKHKIYDWSKQYDTIHLWFDGDDPGIRCANQIMYWCSMHNLECVNHTEKGKKVYQL